MAPPDQCHYLAGFSRASRLLEQQVAVFSEMTRTWHSLTQREWAVLQQAVGSTAASEVAARSTMALQNRLGVRDRLAQCDTWPTWYVAAALSLHSWSRPRIRDLVPVTASEVCRLRDRWVQMNLLVKVSSDRSGEVAGSRSLPLHVSVTTLGQVAALKRCLRGLVDEADRFGVPLVVSVHDGSISHAEEQQHQRLCASVENHAVRIVYRGETWRRALAHHLCRAGVDRPIVEFALWGAQGPRSGETRNAALLANIGSRLLMIDDAVVAHARVPRHRDGRVTLTGHVDPRGFRFARTPARVTRGLVAGTEALWQSHASVLGDTVQSCIDRHGLAEAPSRWTGPASAWGELFAAGRIRATIHGVAGDTGIGWLRRWLILEGPSRTALVRCRRVYEASRASGLASRTSASIHLSGNGSGAEGGLGIDASELLPPFLPGYPASDALFLAMLKHIHPANVVAFLPQTIERWQADADGGTSGAIWERTGVRLSHLVRSMVSRQCFDLPDRGPHERLRAVGRALGAAAAGRLTDLRLMVRDIWRDHVAEWLFATEGVMATYHEQPEWWADDVRRFREQLLAELAGADADLPRDLDDADGRGILRLQHLLMSLSELYQAWPTIWERASTWADHDVSAVHRQRAS